MERESGLEEKNWEKDWLDDVGFADVVFSWSIEDVFNKELYKNKVVRIPEEFQTVEEYFGSFVYPLLEETRVELHSSLEIMSTAPYAEVITCDLKRHGRMMFDIQVDYWRNHCGPGKKSYGTSPGDIFFLATDKLEDVTEIGVMGRPLGYAMVVSEKRSPLKRKTSSS